MAKILFSFSTMMSFATTESKIDWLPSSYNFHTMAAVLRLDEVHPVVSGNKWYKLQRYLQKAAIENTKGIVTYGGAYSNHILATAAACSRLGLQSTGIIRGEEPPQLSPTLQQAVGYGMKLCFVSRTEYQTKRLPEALLESLPLPDVQIIPEGGYGHEGAAGVADILAVNNTARFTHLLTAVGTGTTLAGLVLGAAPHQTVLGIPVLKGAALLQQEVEALLPLHLHHRFQLLDGYHFGGYARHTPELFLFMNAFYSATGIATDFVYTAKAFYAGMRLLNDGYFTANHSLLLIHTGGLQGNRSLKKGTLIFGA